MQQDQGTQELKAQRRAESLTLLQAQLEHEQRFCSQQEQIKSLKDHLATVVERTTKIRSAYEKEKKQLSGQVCHHMSHLSMIPDKQSASRGHNKLVCI
jgi:regulator of replication initiation timing